MSKLYIKDAIRIAKAEVGYLEKASNKDLDDKLANPGAGNWTKYARDLWAAAPHYYQGSKNGIADWCAEMYDWILLMAAGGDAQRAQAAVYYTGPYGASCTYSVRYYKAAGKFHTKNPQLGDQIFFGNATNIRHTGMVVDIQDGIVYTVEGNCNNAVREKQYSISNSDIYGYGTPDWDGYEAPTEPEPEPVPALPTHFNDVPANTWYTDAVIWAVDNGITKGTTDTTFSPFEACTRAQVVTFLHRAAQHQEARTAEMIQEALDKLRAELG